MQAHPHYDDLLDEVTRYLHERVELAQRFGVSEQQVIVDPGLGFGKSVAHNYTLIRELGRIAQLGRPILLGPSRKSFIGAITGKPAQQRRWGTAATVACGIFAGAHIVRVHDVEEMAEVVQVANHDAQPEQGDADSNEFFRCKLDTRGVAINTRQVMECHTH